MRFTSGVWPGTNLLQVAVHEIGHSLGLGHSDVQDAIMAAFYRGYKPDFSLHQDDINGIRSLYGRYCQSVYHRTEKLIQTYGKLTLYRHKLSSQRTAISDIKIQMIRLGTFSRCKSVLPYYVAALTIKKFRISSQVTLVFDLMCINFWSEDKRQLGQEFGLIFDIFVLCVFVICQYNCVCGLIKFSVSDLI